MRKFECGVERQDRFVVEFDESVINEEWMEDFRRYFYDFYDLYDHAEHIALYRARFGGGFIEGYGVPLVNGEIPPFVEPESVNHAINIKVISEDREIDTEIYEQK